MPPRGVCTVVTRSATETISLSMVDAAARQLPRAHAHAHLDSDRYEAETFDTQLEARCTTHTRHKIVTAINKFYTGVYNR
jgi:hypothetical protein